MRYEGNTIEIITKWNSFIKWNNLEMTEWISIKSTASYVIDQYVHGTVKYTRGHFGLWHEYKCP